MAPRITLSLVFLFLFFIARSQEKLAIYAGPQYTTSKYLVRDNKQSTAGKYGYMGGFSLKVPFEGSLYFLPSIYYSRKGFSVTFTDEAYPPSELAINNDITLHTIEISPLLQVDLSKNPSHFFIRFGPAVDYAFSGKESFDTLNTTGSTGNVSRNMKFAFTAYGRYTSSLNGHFGFQSAGGLMVFAHFAYGIGSLNNGDEGPRIVHRVAGLSLGWVFGRRKRSE